MDTAFIADKVKKLLAAEYCCDELVKAGEDWLASRGTDRFDEKTRRLITELKEGIMPIDELIRNCESQRPDWFSSKEEAEELLRHARSIKAAGDKYCDCEACTLAQDILERLGGMDNYNHQKEIGEAIRAGERARESLLEARSKMNSARKWGLYDLFAGGGISSLVKHSRINDATQ